MPHPFVLSACQLKYWLHSYHCDNAVNKQFVSVEKISTFTNVKQRDRIECKINYFKIFVPERAMLRNRIKNTELIACSWASKCIELQKPYGAWKQEQCKEILQLHPSCIANGNGHGVTIRLALSDAISNNTSYQLSRSWTRNGISDKETIYLITGGLAEIYKAVQHTFHCICERLIGLHNIWHTNTPDIFEIYMYIANKYKAAEPIMAVQIASQLKYLCALS